MSTPERAGWYDDPEDESRLRYFDGIIWTENTVSRGPGVRQQPAATAPDQPAGAPTAGHGGAWQAPPVGQQPGPPGTDVYGRPQGGQQQPYQQAGQQPYGFEYSVPHGRPGPTTGDGVPLAGFGQRAGAFIIDTFIIGVIALLASGWAWWRFMAGYLDFVMEAANDPSMMEGLTLQQLTGYFDYQYAYIGLGIVLLVQAVYGIGFLVALGATPGKLALGISVRRIDRPGRLGLGTAFMRMLLSLVMRLLWGITGLIEVVVRTIDLLWPLRDPRRQALHDKIAGTQVVVGRQPPRGGDGSGPA